MGAGWCIPLEFISHAGQYGFIKVTLFDTLNVRQNLKFQNSPLSESTTLESFKKFRKILDSTEKFQLNFR